MVGFLRYYKKFLFHWVKELWSFGGEQVVGVILAILILFFQIRMGLIPTNDVRASALATVFWPYLALIGIYLVVHLVRTPWQLDQELSKQLEHEATKKEIRKQIDILTQFIEQGQEFKRQCRTSNELIPHEQVNTWATEAGESVRKMFDDTYISRFESGVGVPMGGAYWPNIENRHIDGFVLVRIYRLQQFVDELR